MYWYNIYTPYHTKQKTQLPVQMNTVHPTLHTNTQSKRIWLLTFTKAKALVHD